MLKNHTLLGIHCNDGNKFCIDALGFINVVVPGGGGGTSGSSRSSTLEQPQTARNFEATASTAASTASTARGASRSKSLVTAHKSYGFDDCCWSCGKWEWIRLFWEEGSCGFLPTPSRATNTLENQEKGGGTDQHQCGNHKMQVHLHSAGWPKKESWIGRDMLLVLDHHNSK